MEHVALGTKIKSAAILRSNLADGCKGRAILLDKNPAVKQIAFDSTLRRAIEVSQQDCIKYRLSPRPTYYFLIARLNTDLKGVVHGDEFVIEYLQMSESVYNEFIEQVDEMGKFTSIVLSKVSKGEFSYIKVAPSNQYQITEELKTKIRELRKETELIAAMWQMVDINTSISITEYEALLAGQTETPKQVTSREPRPMITSKSETKAKVTDEFDTGDEFADEPVQEVPAQEVNSDVADSSGDEFAGVGGFGDDGFGDFD